MPEIVRAHESESESEYEEAIESNGKPHTKLPEPSEDEDEKSITDALIEKNSTLAVSIEKLELKCKTYNSQLQHESSENARLKHALGMLKTVNSRIQRNFSMLLSGLKIGFTGTLAFIDKDAKPIFGSLILVSDPKENLNVPGILKNCKTQIESLDEEKFPDKQKWMDAINPESPDKSILNMKVVMLDTSVKHIDLDNTDPSYFEILGLTIGAEFVLQIK